MKLGERLRAVITESGQSIEAVARRAEMGPSQLRKIMRGETESPGIVNFARIARALGVTIDYLLIGVDDVEGPDELSLDELSRVLLLLGRTRGKNAAELAALLERIEKGMHSDGGGTRRGPVARRKPKDDSTEQPHKQ